MALQDSKNRKPVNLALQGGGAHGAFTWGVLDKFLEDGRVEVQGISGTSAGAMNGVVAADGLMRGGEDGAREMLYRFWSAVSDAGRFSPLQRSLLDIYMGNWSLDNNPAYILLDLMQRLTSPYDFNLFDVNPLRDILDEMVDFEHVRACDDMKIFVSATNVETGRVKVFNRHELTLDMVMASACLPFLYKAVEINGVPYWDGGYMGNPVLFPFFRSCASDDIIIVQINPIERKGTPKTAREILNRVNEITFNSSLLKELRAIDFVRRLIEEGRLDRKDYRHLNLHMVEAEAAILSLGASSKLNTEWAFLRHLFGVGRDAATDWLAVHHKDLGERSSLDIRLLFQGVPAEQQALLEAVC